TTDAVARRQGSTARDPSRRGCRRYDRHMAAHLLTVAAALLVWAALQAPPHPPAAVPSRIVAVGDVHGGYDEFVRLLQDAGVINARRTWTGGRTRLVQTGDVVDRG